MKKLILFAVVITSFAFTALAQDPPKNVIFGAFDAERRGVTLGLPNGDDLKFDAAKDSLGFSAGYIRFLGNSPVGVGFEAGATFHDRAREPQPCGPDCIRVPASNSKIANAHWLYGLYVQKRTGTFQPFAKAVIGGQNGNLGGMAVGPGGFTSTGPGHQFVAGGGGGLDICSKKNICFRTGITATRSLGGDDSLWNVRGQFGIAVKFGK